MVGGGAPRDEGSDVEGVAMSAGFARRRSSMALPVVCLLALVLASPVAVALETRLFLDLATQGPSPGSLSKAQCAAKQMVTQSREFDEGFALSTETRSAAELACPVASAPHAIARIGMAAAFLPDGERTTSAHAVVAGGRGVNQAGHPTGLLGVATPATVMPSARHHHHGELVSFRQDAQAVSHGVNSTALLRASLGDDLDMGVALSEASAATVGGEVFVFGGLDPDAARTRQGYLLGSDRVYRLGQDGLVPLDATMPVGRWGAAAVGGEDHAWLFGGIRGLNCGNAPAYVSSITRFARDGRGENVSVLPDFVVPLPGGGSTNLGGFRAGAAAARLGNTAVIFGGVGVGGTFLDQIVLYDLLNDTVSVARASLPLGIAYATAAAAEGAVYLIGGMTPSDELNRTAPEVIGSDGEAIVDHHDGYARRTITLNTIFRFDPRDDANLSLMDTRLYLGRHGAAAVALPPVENVTEIFVFGGHHHTQRFEDGAFLGELFAYKPALDTIASTVVGLAGISGVEGEAFDTFDALPPGIVLPPRVGDDPFPGDVRNDGAIRFHRAYFPNAGPGPVFHRTDPPLVFVNVTDSTGAPVENAVVSWRLRWLSGEGPEKASAWWLTGGGAPGSHHVLTDSKGRALIQLGLDTAHGNLPGRHVLGLLATETVPPHRSEESPEQASITLTYDVVAN